MSTAFLTIQNISKNFPGVRALDNISLSFQQSEVHALCGENGAGKSTLMKILSGNLQPDSGDIFLKEQKVRFKDQQEAQDQQIAIVYQERSLVSSLSVAENIFIRNKPTYRAGFINFFKLNRQAQRLLDDLKLGYINPRTPVGLLSGAEQQMVEIAKALAQNPQLLILDEPTASITETETDTLFEIIRVLKEKGVSIIYISHRMAEIFQIADRVSVLKDGCLQTTQAVADTNIEEVIRQMVGRELQTFSAQHHVRTSVALEVQGLFGQAFHDISFTLRQGEILALAGLVGAGRSEVARAIFGADPLYKGKIILEGQPVSPQHPADARNLGIGYLPEERKSNGLFLDMTVEDNLLITYLETMSRFGFINNQQARKEAEKSIQKLNIITPHVRQKVQYLSGGNQQKVVLARWLLRQLKVFIIDEPTHGVDVGAKSEIYGLLKELTRLGVAVLLISSELPEVLTLSDRILVMWNGQITAEMPREEASEEEIMHYASGTKNMYAYS